jgi:hypothetical protein
MRVFCRRFSSGRRGTDGVPSLQAALRVLDLSRERSFSKSVVKTAFLKKAKTAHPDAGGDAAAFRWLQQSYEVVLAHSPSAHSRSRDRIPFLKQSVVNTPEELRAAHRRIRENMDKADSYNAEILQGLQRDAEMQQKGRQHKARENTHRWRRQLRCGWFEEGWVDERVVGDGRVVRTVRRRVTSPTSDDSGGDGNDDSFGESEWEEWTADDGAPRQRTLVQMPVRFELARKVFGDVPFRSPQERHAAREEFGNHALAVKRFRDFFSGWNAWGSGG